MLEGDCAGIQKQFDRLQDISRDYENRCKAQAYELIEKYKQQLIEKDAIISALLKCIRILGGD